MSAYRTAIDTTAAAIQHRARNFRNQIIVVVTISTIAVIAAAVTRSGSWLSTLLLLVPVCGLFLHADNRLLSRWRRHVLTPWVTRTLDFAALGQAVRANPALPKPTLEAMLATLPSAGDLVAEQAVLPPTRQAVAAVSCAIHGTAADALLINVVASAVVVAVALLALWTRDWRPAIGAGVLLLVPVVRQWAAHRQQARCEAEVSACRAQPGFSESDFATMCGALR
ncbi:MAG TPA: hypothetical protein VKE96_25440 [Vicinamibacterales bacterium]|nr:hypothetical protein [Vicinamibacterales bacterium]